SVDTAPFSHSTLSLHDALPIFAPTDWHGVRRNVFCVDFCVGGRYQERQQGVSRYKTKLAALRWPERTLVLDSGEVVNTTRYGNRSEEHTSELQSRENLVCRLLL